MHLQVVKLFAKVQITCSVGEMSWCTELFGLENLALPVTHIGVLASLTQERPLGGKFG